MTDLATGKAVAAPAQFVQILGSWPLGLAIVVLAVAQQAIGHVDADNSWFITFAEKVFDGARPYVDVSDPNPPAGFLAYLPAVAASRWIGFPAEAWTVVEILLCAFASLALCSAILRPVMSLDVDQRGLWRNAALFLLMFASGFAFAEREHFALIACLPMLAAFLARSEDARVAIAPALIAGLSGGVALAFKPYYALPLAAALCVACLRRRSLAPIVALENFFMAGAFAAYLALVWLVWPVYVARVLPLAVEVYAPARNALSLVLASPPFLFNAALLAAVGGASWKSGQDWRATLIAAASAGFLATYVVQAKMWFNHAYPGIALAAFACVVYAAGRRRDAPEFAARFARLAVLPALVCAPFLAAVAMNLPGAEEYPGLTAAVRANAPPQPKIAALAQQLDVGHPLVRRLDGRWIGTQNALWVDNCVRQILTTLNIDDATREKLLGYARDERIELARDIARGRPDVLLVETAALRTWAQGKPEFAGLLDGFAQKAQVGEIEVWARVAKRGNEP